MPREAGHWAWLWGGRKASAPSMGVAWVSEAAVKRGQGEVRDSLGAELIQASSEDFCREEQHLVHWTPKPCYLSLGQWASRCAAGQELWGVGQG